jgi:endonuclease YncB( thermonuclease family)
MKRIRQMAKLCPKCKEQNEVTAIGCKCGFFFVEEIEESQSQGLAELRHLRRKRMYAKVVGLLGTATLLLAFAAYFGGFFRPQVEADNPDPPRLIAGQPSKDTNQALLTNPAFPENNVSYEVTKVFTGASIGVTDANKLERRVTLLGIRVPKLDENFGRESKESLSNLVTNKSLIIKPRKFTKEADVIAEVMIDGSNIGLQQILKGMALLVPEEVSGFSEVEQRQYFEAATNAKNGRYGVWSDKKGVDQSIGEIARGIAPTNGSTGPLVGNVETKTGGIKATLPGKYRTYGNKVGKSVDNMGFDPVPDPNAAPVVSEGVEPPLNTKLGGVANEPAPSSPGKAVAAPSSESKYIRGPLGGCYYLNSKGNKSYVDRSMCN